MIDDQKTEIVLKKEENLNQIGNSVKKSQIKCHKVVVESTEKKLAKVYRLSKLNLKQNLTWSYLA